MQPISNPKKEARGPGQEAGAWPGGAGRGQQGTGGGALLRAAGPSPGTTRTRLPAAGPQPPGATGGPQRLPAEPQEMQKHCRHPPSRRRLSLCEAPPTCIRRGRSAEEPGPARAGAQLSAVWGRERRASTREEGGRGGRDGREGQWPRSDTGCGPYLTTLCSPSPGSQKLDCKKLELLQLTELASLTSEEAP